MKVSEAILYIACLLALKGHCPLVIAFKEELKPSPLGEREMVAPQDLILQHVICEKRVARLNHALLAWGFHNF